MGFLKGLYSDTTVPKFNIEIASNNASFNIQHLKPLKILLLTLKSSMKQGSLMIHVNLEKLSFRLMRCLSQH
jgi:hypothetical protein